ncbi:MAG: hypothetical protein QM817_19835 [Archangium sp.]
MRAASTAIVRLVELDEFTAELMITAQRPKLTGLPVAALSVSERATLESDDASK